MVRAAMLLLRSMVPKGRRTNAAAREAARSSWESRNTHHASVLHVSTKSTTNQSRHCGRTLDTLICACTACSWRFDEQATYDWSHATHLFAVRPARRKVQFLRTHQKFVSAQKTICDVWSLALHHAFTTVSHFSQDNVQLSFQRRRLSGLLPVEAVLHLPRR